MSRSITFLYFLLLFSIPTALVNAQTKPVLRTLVPCGRAGTEACQFCHFYVLVDNIIFDLVLIVIPLAILAVAVGGFFLLTAGGNPSNISRGRNIIISAIIGVILTLIAWVAVDTIMSTLVKGGSFGARFPWNEFPACSSGGSGGSNVPSSNNPENSSVNPGASACPTCGGSGVCTAQECTGLKSATGQQCNWTRNASTVKVGPVNGTCTDP